MTHQLPSIISDEPEDRHAQFGFADYAKTIADIMANSTNRTPLVIGDQSQF